MHSEPDRDDFCWSRDTVLFCVKNEYLQTHFYVFTTRIVTRLTATTAILSRMCRQVWVGTLGICRLHARAPIPMQTSTLGTSRCTDRYIRHMQISAHDVCNIGPRYSGTWLCHSVLYLSCSILFCYSMLYSTVRYARYGEGWSGCWKLKAWCVLYLHNFCTIMPVFTR